MVPVHGAARPWNVHAKFVSIFIFYFLFFYFILFTVSAGLVGLLM